MDILILIAVGFLFMWLLVVLPQRRRQAAQKAMHDSLRPGLEVLTAGGMYGDVTEVGEDEVAIEIAPGVVVRLDKRAVAAVIPPDAYEDDDETEADAFDAEPDGAHEAPAVDGAPAGTSDSAERR